MPNETLYKHSHLFIHIFAHRSFGNYYFLHLLYFHPQSSVMKATQKLRIYLHRHFDKLFRNEICMTIATSF